MLEMVRKQLSPNVRFCKSEPMSDRPSLPLDMIPDDFAISDRNDMRIRVARVDDDHALGRNAGVILELTTVRYKGGRCMMSCAAKMGHDSRVQR